MKRLWAWLRARPTWPPAERVIGYVAVVIAATLLGGAVWIQLNEPSAALRRVERASADDARWCARALRVFARTPTDTLDLLTLKPDCAAFVIERRAAQFVPDNYVPARD